MNQTHQHKGEEKELKEWLDGAFKGDITIKAMGNLANLGGKMLELEAISNWISLMYGVEIEVYVKPAERKEGRFYGRSLVEELTKQLK